jgi:hypothetical protein
MRPRPFAQSLGIPLPKKTFERSYRLHGATMKVHRTLREGAGHLFAAIRSLNVHGYDTGYMLRTTRKIR